MRNLGALLGLCLLAGCGLSADEVATRVEVKAQSQRGTSGVNRVRFIDGIFYADCTNGEVVKQPGDIMKPNIIGRYYDGQELDTMARSIAAHCGAANAESILRAVQGR